METVLPIGILISVVLLADSSPSDHRAWEEEWGETERKQTREGGRWLQWRKKQRYRGTPFACREMSSADRVTHHHLNASLSAGTPCCPATSPSPCRCHENPDRDDYQWGKEIRITLLVIERKKWQHSWPDLASVDQQVCLILPSIKISIASEIHFLWSFHSGLQK